MEGGKGADVVEEWSKNVKEGTDNKAIHTRYEVKGWWLEILLRD